MFNVSISLAKTAAPTQRMRYMHELGLPRAPRPVASPLGPAGALRGGQRYLVQLPRAHPRESFPGQQARYTEASVIYSASNTSSSKQQQSPENREKSQTKRLFNIRTNRPERLLKYLCCCTEMLRRTGGDTIIFRTTRARTWQKPPRRTLEGRRLLSRPTPRACGSLHTRSRVNFLTSSSRALNVRKVPQDDAFVAFLSPR